MADYTERDVTRTFTEWRIPVRSLGSLPEWAKLEVAITNRIGVVLAEQHGVLQTRIEGDDDDSTLVMSFDHGPRTLGELIGRDLSRALARPEDDPEISADDLVAYTIEHGFAIEILRGETATMVNRLKVLLGHPDDAGNNGITGSINFAPGRAARWVAVPDVPPNFLRVGAKVYRLGENDTRLTRVPSATGG